MNELEQPEREKGTYFQTPGHNSVNELSRDKGIPKSVNILAILVGGALIVCGAYYCLTQAAYVETIPIHFGALILCAGLAVVLAAFGSLATGTWKSFTVTGGIAGAIILYLLQYETLPKVVPTLRGEFRGTSPFSQVTMWGSGPMFVSRRKFKGDFEFAIFPDDLDHTNEVSVNVTTAKGTEFTINCVKPEVFANHFGEAAPLGLALRGQNEDGPWLIFDSKNTSYGRFDNDDCDAQQTGVHSIYQSSTPENSRSIIGVLLQYIAVDSAIAQVTPPQPSDKSKDRDVADIKAILEGLNSDDSNVRIGSRIQLSQRTSWADLAITESNWNIVSGSYRDDLGRLIAWNDAVKRDQSAGSRLIRTLGKDKIEHVIYLTGHQDITMRIAATAFLSKLLADTAGIEWINSGPKTYGDGGKLTPQPPLQITPKEGGTDENIVASYKSDVSKVGLGDTDKLIKEGADKLWSTYLDVLSMTDDVQTTQIKPEFVRDTGVMAYNQLVALASVACRIPPGAGVSSVVQVLDEVDWEAAPTGGRSGSTRQLADQVKSKIEGRTCDSRAIAGVE